MVNNSASSFSLADAPRIVASGTAPSMATWLRPQRRRKIGESWTRNGAKTVKMERRGLPNLPSPSHGRRNCPQRQPRCGQFGDSRPGEGKQCGWQDHRTADPRRQTDAANAPERARTAGIGAGGVAIAAWLRNTINPPPIRKFSTSPKMTPADEAVSGG